MWSSQPTFNQSQPKLILRTTGRLKLRPKNRLAKERKLSAEHRTACCTGLIRKAQISRLIRTLSTLCTTLRQMETKRAAVHGGSKEQHVRATGLHKRRLFNFALVRPAEVNLWACALSSDRRRQEVEYFCFFAAKVCQLKLPLNLCAWES